MGGGYAPNKLHTESVHLFDSRPNHWGMGVAGLGGSLWVNLGR